MTISPSHRGGGRAAFAAAVGAMLLAAVACSGGDDDEAGQTTTTERVATTTTAPDTDSAEDEEPDWAVIVPELYEKVYLLQARPNPDDRTAIEAVYAPACECFADFVAGIENLAKNRWRMTGGPPTVVEVAVSGTHTSEGALPAYRLTVTTDAPNLHIVNSSGETVSTPPAGRFKESILVIPDGAGGSWRIHDELPLPTDGGA